jgi:hypothetical protein
MDRVGGARKADERISEQLRKEVLLTLHQRARDRTVIHTTAERHRWRATAIELVEIATPILVEQASVTKVLHAGAAKVGEALSEPYDRIVDGAKHGR